MNGGAVLLGLHLVFFPHAHPSVCCQAPELQALAALSWLLPLPTLGPSTQQGSAHLSTQRPAPGRQKCSKDSGIRKRSFLLLLLSSERSASPSCFPSWREGPGHVATARLHHICCLIAPWAACTARSAAMEPSQQTSVRETFPLTWLSVMTEESKPRIKQHICTFLILYLPVRCF